MYKVVSALIVYFHCFILSSFRRLLHVDVTHFSSLFLFEHLKQIKLPGLGAPGLMALLLVESIDRFDSSVASVASEHRGSVLHFLHVMRQESLRLKHHWEGWIIYTPLRMSYHLFLWLSRQLLLVHSGVAHRDVHSLVFGLLIIIEGISPQLHAHPHISR